MNYYSTNHQSPDATLEEAVVKGLAPDRGLYMPYSIKELPPSFYAGIDALGFQDIACRVADAFFGEDIPADTLHDIVEKKPTSLEAFSTIQGVGELKLEKYGKVFVALIRFILHLPQHPTDESH